MTIVSCNFSGQFHRHDIPLSVSVTTPAVRMVVIIAGTETDDVDDGKTPTVGDCWHSFAPVVAIQATLKRMYDFYGDKRPNIGITHDQMTEFGWLYLGETIDYTPIVPVEGRGLHVAVYGNDGDDVQIMHQAFEAAPWPPEEDEVRFAETIDCLKMNVIAIAKRRINSTQEVRP